MQIKSAVASVEDSGDGPISEELDETTKVCCTLTLTDAFSFFLITACWCQDNGIDKSTSEG